jgi:MFS family permease
MTRNLSQSWRVVFLIAYLIVLVLVNALLFEEFPPTGLWFWSAFLTLLLSEFISQPYFTAPKDAVSNSIAAISTVFSLIATSVLDSSVQGFWIGFLTISAIILVSAIVAMTLGNTPNPRSRTTAQILTQFSGVFGSPKVLFTAIFFLSLYTFYDQAAQVFWLSLTWIVVVLGRPLESLFHLYNRIRKLWADVTNKVEIIGQVVVRGSAVR